MKRIAFSIFALAFVVAACGGDDDASAADIGSASREDRASRIAMAHTKRERDTGINGLRPGSGRLPRHWRRRAIQAIP